MGIKVGWIDKLLREIGARKITHILIRETQLLRKRIEELQQEMEKAECRLRVLDTEMVYRDFSTHYSIITILRLLKERTEIVLSL